MVARPGACACKKPFASIAATLGLDDFHVVAPPVCGRQSESLASSGPTCRVLVSPTTNGMVGDSRRQACLVATVAGLPPEPEHPKASEATATVPSVIVTRIR